MANNNNGHTDESNVKPQDSESLVESIAVAIKKYNIDDGDIICMTLPVDLDGKMLQRIHMIISQVIKETGKKASVMIMSDPADLYRLKPTDMAILGWFPFDEDVLDKLNKAGAITYQERLAFMMMNKRLKSMMPKDPIDLLTRNMKIMKGKDNG